MKNRNFIPVFASLLVIGLLSSCQKGLMVCLFNNAGKRTTVVIHWSHGKTQQIEIASGKHVSFFWPETLSIRCGSNEWSYAPLPRVNPTLLHARKSAYYLDLQLEPGGMLYSRTNIATSIQTNFVNQLPGYPLTPINTNILHGSSLR